MFNNSSQSKFRWAQKLFTGIAKPHKTHNLLFVGFYVQNGFYEVAASSLIFASISLISRGFYFLVLLMQARSAMNFYRNSKRSMLYVKMFHALMSLGYLVIGILQIVTRRGDDRTFNQVMFTWLIYESFAVSTLCPAILLNNYFFKKGLQRIDDATIARQSQHHLIQKLSFIRKIVLAILLGLVPALIFLCTLFAPYNTVPLTWLVLGLVATCISVVGLLLDQLIRVIQSFSVQDSKTAITDNSSVSANENGYDQIIVNPVLYGVGKTIYLQYSVPYMVGHENIFYFLIGNTASLFIANLVASIFYRAWVHLSCTICLILGTIVLTHPEAFDVYMSAIIIPITYTL
jgi:hypothetical protein